MEEEAQEDAEGVADDPDLRSFTWDEDYQSFHGQREEFLEQSGPTIEGTAPIDLFLQIWDQRVMDMICDQTNLYAWQTIVAAVHSETGISNRSRLHAWVDTVILQSQKCIWLLVFQVAVRQLLF